MQEIHRVSVEKNDPEIHFVIRQDIWDDVKARAKENGRSLNVEILIRLARTLEDDYHRDEFDRNFEKIFFVDDE